MIAWVLIVALSANSTASSSNNSNVSMQRFETQAACETALAWVRQNASRVERITCLPTGTTP